MLSSETDLVEQDDALLICIGNVLRGDDGLAAALEPELAAHRCNVIVAHQLVPELAWPLSQARLAIFIDAAIDLRAGRVRCRRVDPSTAAAQRLCHHHDAAALLRLTQTVYGRAPQSWEISVGGQSWNCGESLSPPVVAALRRVLRLVDALLARHSFNRSSRERSA
jgi:hydrogenase maturation protease